MNRIVGLAAFMTLVACAEGDEGRDSSGFALTTPLPPTPATTGESEGDSDEKPVDTTEAPEPPSGTSTTEPADPGTSTGEQPDMTTGEPPPDNTSGTTDMTTGPDTTSTTSGEPPPPPPQDYYGNPDNGCLPGEQSVTITGLQGAVCSFGPCDLDLDIGCPPSPVQAFESCILELEGVGSCALVCELANNNNDCPVGATCQDIMQQGFGLCTYE